MTTHVLVCTVTPAPTCPPEAQQFVAVDDAMSPDQLGVTSHTVGEVFGWGFGSVLFFWFLGYTVGAALRVVRLV